MPGTTSSRPRNRPTSDFRQVQAQEESFPSSPRSKRVWNDELQAVRDPQWKLVLPHKYRTLAGKAGGKGGIPAQYESASVGIELYDMKNDRSETKNVAQDHPEVVARLQAAAESWRNDLGDKLTNRKGTGVRPHATMTGSDATLK